jgi:outer membrane biosynthesis protein TonB
MFCQSCGQKNIEEARFCNFCGERIAAPGTPGGRLDVEPSARASASEPWGSSMTLGDSLAMSLAGIGIRTRGRAYGLVVTLALSLMALGGVVVYVLSGSGEPPVADKGHASPGDTFLVGVPIPEGLDLPPYPGEPSGAEPAPDAPALPSSGPRESRPAASRPAPSGDAQQERPPTAAPTAPASPSATSARVHEPPPAPTPQAPKQDDPPAPPPAPPPAEVAPTPPKDPAAETELELYAGRVRFAISRYYAGATKSCFDKATQLDSTLSGTVVIATKVAADGQVKDASPSRNSTGDQSLGECLASQVRSFRLPPPPNGEIELKLPFSR